MFYPHRLYLPRSGTAHRPFPTYFNGRAEMNDVGRPNNCQLSIFSPFPTMRLDMSTFAPAVSAIRNAVPPVLRIPRLKTPTNQRNRRERPMCRSAPGSTGPLPMKNRNVPPLCHSDRSVSGVEESTTWDKEPPQDKTSHLGRFLGSVSLSLGMT